MVIFLYNVYVFVLLQQGCFADMVFARLRCMYKNVIRIIGTEVYKAPYQ